MQSTMDPEQNNQNEVVDFESESAAEVTATPQYWQHILLGLGIAIFIAALMTYIYIGMTNTPANRTEEPAPVTVEEGVDEVGISEEERLKILESLSDDAEPVAEEERGVILDSLADEEDAEPISEENRLSILESLEVEVEIVPEPESEPEMTETYEYTEPVVENNEAVVETEETAVEEETVDAGESDDILSNLEDDADDGLTDEERQAILDSLGDQ